MNNNFKLFKLFKSYINRINNDDDNEINQIQELLNHAKKHSVSKDLARKINNTIISNPFSIMDNLKSISLDNNIMWFEYNEIDRNQDIEKLMKEYDLDKSIREKQDANNTPERIGSLVYYIPNHEKYIHFITVWKYKDKKDPQFSQAIYRWNFEKINKLSNLDFSKLESGFKDIFERNFYIKMQLMEIADVFFPEGFKNNMDLASGIGGHKKNNSKELYENDILIEEKNATSEHLFMLALITSLNADNLNKVSKKEGINLILKPGSFADENTFKREKGKLYIL